VARHPTSGWKTATSMVVELVEGQARGRRRMLKRRRSRLMDRSSAMGEMSTDIIVDAHSSGLSIEAKPA
jgi:hypothetical protein